MTERRTNRLLGVGDQSAGQTATGAPHNIDDYVVWLNGKEQRRGRWAIVEKNGSRTIDFRTEIATDERLREMGMVPKIGRAA